jgi:hypothetical protein
MTSVWVVLELSFHGERLQGLYASMDAVLEAFPAPIEWKDISDEHGQEWEGTLAATDERPYGTDYSARLLPVIE